MNERRRRWSVSRSRRLPWWPLIAVTTADYLWQIPYAVHQYGRQWDSLAGLSTPLIITGLWFTVAVLATVGGRRGGRPALAAFLVTEATFYLVHNISGAFAADLPLGNPVVLIASVLGYLSTVTAAIYLFEMALIRRSTATAGTLRVPPADGPPRGPARRSRQP
ncbi:hypothetical protein [Jatrophihabitans sp.]|jgi:hypothetical protein|uniref:hypothetical protein n=1 Tax=Jatrophihabitans sp. TaxID=1932789 RepID=UPI002E193492